MAIKGNAGGDGSILVGEDKILELSVTDDDGAAVDMTGWTVQFVMQRRLGESPSTLSLAATIVGTYNADPNLNTQRARVTLTDTDHTDALSAVAYSYSWKRVDPGLETVLRFGTMTWQQTTQ